jgi:hypothetical protein
MARPISNLRIAITPPDDDIEVDDPSSQQLAEDFARHAQHMEDLDLGVYGESDGEYEDENIQILSWQEEEDAKRRREKNRERRFRRGEATVWDKLAVWGEGKVASLRKCYVFD